MICYVQLWCSVTHSTQSTGEYWRKIRELYLAQREHNLQPSCIEGGMQAASHIREYEKFQMVVSSEGQSRVARLLLEGKGLVSHSQYSPGPFPVRVWLGETSGGCGLQTSCYLEAGNSCSYSLIDFRITIKFVMCS